MNDIHFGEISFLYMCVALNWNLFLFIGNIFPIIIETGYVAFTFNVCINEFSHYGYESNLDNRLLFINIYKPTN